MGDIKSKKLIIFKGFLFLGCGGVAAVTLLAENWNWHNALLLTLAIGSFCRFYYFAFYVIEHYVDSTYKFSSLWSFARYWLRKRAQ